MPNIYDQSRAFRQSLADDTNNAATQMIAAYGAVWANELAPQIDRLVIELSQEGIGASQNKRHRLDRLRQLQADLAARIGQLQEQISAVASAQALAAVDAARQDAEAGITAGISPPPGISISGVFNRANTRAVETLTGFLQPNGPLGNILQQAANGTPEAIVAALQAGIAMGTNPRVIARQVRRELGGSLSRSLTIARTETFRAYREISRATYEANKHLVPTYLWLCAKQDRTCALCWSMNGKEFSVDTPFGTHPNCRCTMVPKTISYAELAKKYGLPPSNLPTGPDVKKLVGNGADLFAALPPEKQLKILGPQKYQAYKEGRLKLADLVGYHDDPVWGPVRYEKTAKALGLPPLQPSKKGGSGSADSTPADSFLAQATAIEAEQIAAINSIEAEIAELLKQADTLNAELTEIFNLPYNDPGKARYDGVVGQRIQILDQIKAARIRREAERETLASRQRALLHVDKPATVQPVGSPQAKKIAAPGYQAFNSFVSAGMVPVGSAQVVLGRQARSHYNPTTNQVVLGTGQRDNQANTNRTIVHELGHWVEENNKDLHQQILAFYHDRTEGSDLTHMGPGYDADEVTRRDQFISPYMGKEYISRGNQYATEILSMGLEYFYTQPTRLAKEDPDYFNFIYNVVRGVPYVSTHRQNTGAAR